MRGQEAVRKERVGDRRGGGQEKGGGRMHLWLSDHIGCGAGYCTAVQLVMSLCTEQGGPGALSDSTTHGGCQEGPRSRVQCMRAGPLLMPACPPNPKHKPEAKQRATEFRDALLSLLPQQGLSCVSV